MCEFLSAWASRTGEVYTHPTTDSHNDLAEWFGIREEHAIPVEFLPGEDITDLDSYTLRFDAERPSWATDEWAASVKKELRSRVAKMIVTDDSRSILLGGCWIITGEATIDHIPSGSRIITISGSARVKHISGSVQVKHIYDSAQVEHISGSARVEHISGSAQVG